MRQRVKPFTLFLWAIILLFLIFGPRFLHRGLKRPILPKDQIAEEPKFSGIIKIWHVDYIQSGKGSVLNWIEPAINRIESRYSDVFFDIKSITPERLDMYFQGSVDRDILPDIISLSPYENRVPKGILEDIGEYISEDSWIEVIDTANEAVDMGDRTIGVPYMTGWYTFLINGAMGQEPRELDWAGLNEFVETSNEGGVGFISYNMPYSKPLDCMGHSQIDRWIDSEMAPENLYDMSYGESWNIFGIGEEAGIFLGSTRAIYDMRARQNSGKGFHIKPVPIPSLESFQLDQIGIYGIVEQEDEDKKLICIDFLLELLEEDMQTSLDKIGMFSIRKDIQTIYRDDKDMRGLEEQLNTLYKQ